MNKLGGNIEGYSEDEDKIVYHYGRPGERLKNAEESVRRFHVGEGPQPPKGIFRSLVQTRSSRLILLVMLSMMAIVILTGIMDRGNGSSTVGLVPVSLTAFSFEDTVYISLQLQENSKVSHPQPPQVSCNFMLYNTDQQLVHQVEQETFYTGKEEFLRTTFGDYDILYVEAVVTVGDQTRVLHSEITRN